MLMSWNNPLSRSAATFLVFFFLFSTYSQPQIFPPQRDLQASKSSEETLDNKLTLSRERVEQLESQVANLQSSQQELTALLSKNDQSEHSEQLAKRNETLEKQLEKEQAKNQTFKEQQFQLSKLIEELEGSRKQKNDQIAQFKAEVQAMKLEQAAQTHLAGKVKELEGEREKALKVQKTLGETQAEVERSRREQDQIRRELDDSAAATKKLEFSLKSAELDNEDLLAQMDGYTFLLICDSRPSPNLLFPPSF